MTLAMPAGRAVDRLLTAGDAETAAASTLDPAVLAWINGGAGDGQCAARNREAFTSATLKPRVLRDVATVATETAILGAQWPLPLAIAPMAYHALAHPEAEIATVTGAAATGTPMCVSMFATRLLEDIAARAGAPLWLQVYPLREWDALIELALGARRAGYQALVLTADCPILGQRSAPFPSRDGMLPVNLPPRPEYATPAGHQKVIDPGWTWHMLRDLAHQSAMPVIVKGILDPRDAGKAAEFGARAIIVSNHGGRQLEQAPATLTVLPEITAAARSSGLPVLVDSGIRTGTDIALALDAGAAAVLVGRPILHALAAGGAAGVRAYLEQLGQELHRVLTLTGRASVHRHAGAPVRRHVRAAPLSLASTSPARSPPPHPLGGRTTVRTPSITRAAAAAAATAAMILPAAVAVTAGTAPVAGAAAIDWGGVHQPAIYGDGTHPAQV